MKRYLKYLFAAILLIGFCGCEEDVSELDSFESILGSDSKDNVIYYVTTDNRALEVDESCFNAPIFKHEYYKDKGYGEIVFMADVTTIGDSAFRDYNTDSPKLERIKIPDTVTEIGDYAFSYCANLTSIEIPDSVTEIGENAFRSCRSLKSITIPDSVTSIGENAFELCGLINVTIPGSVVEMGKGAFNNCDLTSLTICNGVTSIGEEAFFGCQSLTSVTIPDSVINIGSGAFGSCSSLKNIHLPNSVTNIGMIAFAWCESLWSVDLGNSVTSIGNQAFDGCTSLTSITIPDSVTSIGKSAFSGCTSLTSVYCKATTPPVGGSSMFYNNASGRKIYVPAESVKTYKNAIYWSGYADDIMGYDFDNSKPVEIVKATISSILNLGQGSTIATGTTIEAFVISNHAELNNLTSVKTLYVQDDTGGLQFFCASNHGLKFGDKVQINLGGAVLGSYEDAVQIAGLDPSNITLISSNNTIYPKTVTISDFLANKYEGQYVAIEGVQVADSDLNKTWVMDDTHTKINIEDSNGNSFVVFSSRYANYGAEIVAGGSGTIKGISSINKGIMQIIFTQKSDYADMTHKRFTSYN